MVKIKIKRNNNLCELSQNSAVELIASETGKIWGKEEREIQKPGKILYSGCFVNVCSNHNGNHKYSIDVVHTKIKASINSYL